MLLGIEVPSLGFEEVLPWDSLRLVHMCQSPEGTNSAG